ncbi:MAG: cysteine desulfurase NifS [Zymomonas mobilis]|uniref:Cysteine desulfurase n=1 Tax=Zymomonas mobilis TaxID=542 RepID=A0A542W3G7_ZYMMB|nr:cysteine desulfurase NifS [Zymomonas mobilis]TQL18114.1 cysteine desulfurase [Zymomonas mobilis]
MRFVYLDNNATTRVDPEIATAIWPFFSENFGNSSSLHQWGMTAKKAIRTARQQVQKLLDAAEEQEIIFTSGGTEANNTAILSALVSNPDRNEIITSAVEHPAILSLCAWLQKYRNLKIHYIGVDHKGRLDMEAYRQALNPKTALVSFMAANNETGTIFPIEILSRMAHEAGSLFHTDAVQIIGKLPVSVQNSDIDMLSMSGHKLHAPKGIGVLYVRKGLKLQPLIRGGHQERGRRGGTENVPAIVGLGLAAERARQSLSKDNSHIAPLRDQLEQGLLDIAGNGNAMVLGDKEHRLSNTLNIAFENTEGEALLTFLDKAGIAASSGSACASGSIEPSHVLRAMKIPYTFAYGAIRFSFSYENTEEDIRYVLEKMKEIWGNNRIRRNIL